MTTSGRGNPRFKAGGSLWKSSWRKRVPYTEMAFFSNFSDGLGANYYRDATALSGETGGGGFWIGTVVRIVAPPKAGQVSTIARSTAGGAFNGWDLVVTNPGSDADGFSQVGFAFRLGNGVATIVAFAGPFSLRAIETGEADALVFRIAGFQSPPSMVFGKGSVVLFAEDSTLSGVVDMGAAQFTNPGTPALTVGVGAASTAFGDINGIHGLVGGLSALNASDAQTAFRSWIEEIAAGYELVSLNAVSVGNSNAWRANDPKLSPGDAPNPLLPFVGLVNLDFNTPGGTPVTYNLYSPTVFWLDTQ